MIRPTRAALLSCLLASAAGCATPSAPDAPPHPVAATVDQAAVAAVLDRLHEAASKADGASYFALYTPEAVFIGTDVTERWSLTEFRAYAEPYFSQGKGWTYKPRSRQVVLGPDGRTAWFDEVLDSESYGTSRGTGVLVRTAEGWKVAQYALTYPIPNALAKEMTARIRAHEAGSAAPR